jgi:putative heme-binding domain-containing protein
LRVQALSILVTRAPRLAEPQFELLVQQLGEGSLASLAAADVLSRVHLNDVQLTAALKALPEHSAVRPATLIPSLRQCNSATSASALLDRVAVFAPNLSDKELSVLAGKMPPEMQPRLEKLRAFAEESRAANHQKLDKFAPLLEGGDAERGRSVFYSPTAACATCHAIGTQGGRIGPDLTRIGSIRSGRDILESILLPSSTFAQTYEPYAVITTDGRELNGTLARQESDSILLRDPTGNEIELPRDLVRELHRQDISIMPEGLESAMSEAEFRDLLGFLQGLK